jgi:hypothetical protein
MFMAGSKEIPINNGAVFNISQIIKAVMSSAAEAKLGTLFINAKTAAYPIAHAHPNRQFNRTCTAYQQDPPQGIEGHGYAISLVAMLWCAEQILFLLEARETKLSRLLDQASPGQPPQVFPTPNFDINNRSRVS